MNASETSGISVPPPPIGDEVTGFARELLTVALAEYGVKEDPLGSNSGPRVNQYICGLDGRGDWLLELPARSRPWCARFAAWCCQSAFANGAIGCQTLPSALRGGGCASGYKWKAWAKGAGRIRYEPAPGRIGVIMHDDGTSHVVICASWTYDDNGLRSFTTIEGNASNTVDCRRRPVIAVTHWIDVS